jgi:hypothetical protein
MKNIFAGVFLMLIFNLSVSAQNHKIILVKAGTKVLDYFPVSTRYRYPEFVPGQVVFKNGKTSNITLNYNMLFAEIEFIQSRDTLAITKKDDIRYVVALDTFFYDNGYIEVISGGQIRVGLKQYVKFKDVLKKGAYGTTSRGSSIDTYSSMWANGNSFELTPNEDIELEWIKEYYISVPSGGFTEFRKKNVINLFPQREDDIKAYLKANKVDFESRGDLLRFADYLRSL